MFDDGLATAVKVVVPPDDKTLEGVALISTAGKLLMVTMASLEIIEPQVAAVIITLYLFPSMDGVTAFRFRVVFVAPVMSE